MKWEITSEKVQKVISKIIEISNPRKLILFGSYFVQTIMLIAILIYWW